MQALEELLRNPGIWRAGEQRQETGLEHVASGFPALDEALPGGGWPLGALTEVLHEHSGVGELSLFMPALASLGERGRWLALVAPPYLPYAPALAAQGIDPARLLLVHPASGGDALWAVEQALRSGTCGAVLAWPRQADARSLRRLQLAAEAGGSLGLIFRPRAQSEYPSPAALRLGLEGLGGHARVRLLKCRGGGVGQERIVDPYRAECPTGDPPGRGEDAAAPAAPRPATDRSARSRGGRPRAVQVELPLTPTPRT